MKVSCTANVSVLPRKASLAEVAVGTDLVVVHVQQAEGLDDALGCQVVGVTDVLFNELQRLVLGTEALDSKVEMFSSLGWMMVMETFWISYRYP